MKNLTILFLFLLGTFNSISAQVTSVKYLIEYNETTSLYDVKLSIEVGSATTLTQRAQFNSQISVVVPTGSTIATAEFFNPIEDNQTYTGTVPCVWELGTGAIAPPIQPEEDFYSIVPILSPAPFYNNIFADDLITLFSLDINVDPCDNSVRLFENGVDPSSAEMPDSWDYSNGFTIGSTDQIYDGNLTSTYSDNWIVTLPDYDVCEGECVELVPTMVCAPEGLTYLWNTGETTATITVCPFENTIYSVEILSSVGVMNSASNTVSVVEAPIAAIAGASVICPLGTTFVTPSTGGTWVSNDPAVAVPTNDGVVTGIQAGIAELYFTDSSTGCISAGIEITVNTTLSTTITGSDSICVNGTTTLIPNTGGTWVSSNPVVGTIDNTGNVTAQSVGHTQFTYTDLTTGCSSLPSDTVWVLDDPEVAFIGDDRLCIGETSSVSPSTGGTWVSNNSSINIVATIVPITGIITGVAQGTTTFTYTDATTGCSATTTGLIVDPVPSVSVDNITICITSTATLTPTLGGTWVGLNSEIASLTGTTVTGVASGEAGFIFTADATGCTSDTLFINVDAGPITTLTGPNQICIGGTTTIEPVSGGTWAASDPSIATVDNFGNITGVGLGVTQFIFTSSSTLCASDPSVPIQVNPQPIVSAPSTSLCIEETMSLSPSFGGTWVSSDPSVATVNAFTGVVTTITDGKATFTFTSGTTGCIATTQEVMINPAPFAEFTGPDIICAGFTTAVSPTSGGTWVSSAPGIATIDNLGNVTGISAGMAELTYTNTNTGCSSDPLKVTVLAAPPVSITGDDEICIGGTTTLSPTTGGTWFSKNLSVATITNTGVVTGVGAGFTTFVFTTDAGPCESTDSDPVTVNGPDTVVLDKEELCIGETASASATGIGTWTSSDPLVATIEVGTGLITAVGEGSATFTFTNMLTTCISDPSVQIIVNQCQMPTMSCEDIGPDNVYCDYDVLGQLTGSLNAEDSQGNQPSGILCDSEAGNIMWIGFIALEGDYEIVINGTVCTPQSGGSPGIQVGLYSSCDFEDEDNQIFCDVGSAVDNEIMISSNILIPGNVYYMFIDGIDNSTCEFDIDVNGNYDNFYCTDLSKVTGTAYIDANENGQFDEDETPLRNVLVSLSPGNISVLTNDEGKYIINTPKGGATLTAQTNEGEWVEALLTLEDVAVLEECVEDINFGFVPSPISNFSATLSVSNTIVRCDWETKFYITVENTGTEPFDGILEFEFDDEATFFNSPIPNLNINGNILTAETGELLPFVPMQYEITLKMPSGSSVLSTLDFKAELKDANEARVEEYSFSEQLRCSYDPNDKRAFPDREGVENLTLMDEEIEYTIRFQNNGNDTAFLVKIVDVLDSNIDPRSIRVVNASHDVETCIENNTLTFLFEDINLVDSMTNYEGSQGFVTFRSNTKEGVVEFTPVYNTADIIFDTNVPIITNTTLNTLVSVLCTNVTTEIDVEICEGESYEGYEESGVYTNIIPLAFGCDSMIIINLDVQGITFSSQEINICEGDSLILNGNLITITESQEVLDTVINANGCISSVLKYDIELIPTTFINIDTTICEGMEYEGYEESGVYFMDSFDPVTGCDIITEISLDVLPLSDPLCTVVGIEELLAAEVKVYPNPANNIVNIEGLSAIETVAIYTIDYSKISEENFTSGKTKVQLDTERLHQGLYFLTIKSKGKFIYKKLIIE